MRLPTEKPRSFPKLIPGRLIGRTSFVFGLLIVLASSAAAQAPQSTPAQTSQSASPPATLHSTTTLVLVPALVRAPDSELVYSLTAGDFELTDNGVPQKLTLEPDAAQPLALVVLMQIGGAARRQVRMFAHLDTMLAPIVGDAPSKVAIVEFDSRPEYDSPFTSNVSDWTDSLDNPEDGDDGAAIFDGIAYALDLLKQQPPDTRRAILLISQQHDQGSKAQVKDIIRRVGETNTAVYSLTFSVEKGILKDGFAGFAHLTRPDAPMGGPIDGFDADYFDLLAPAELAIGAMHRNLAAETANLSGGEGFNFSNKIEFDRALNILSNHIHNGYTLSFRPSSNQPGLHTLKLRVVGHPELLIDARTGYWAEDSSMDSSIPE